MKNLFFCDIEKGNITYADLNVAVKAVLSYESVCQESEIIDVFIKIITSLVFNEELILLDSDFSDTEREKLLQGVNIYRKKIDTSKINSIFDVDFLSQKLWRLTLFTSGTTGQPKKIVHTIETLTRNIKVGKDFENDVWGFAYNPTHMAGVQVFLQAFLNKNMIVKMFGLSRENIFKSMSQFEVSNISATPTFYRLLMPVEQKYEKVKRITFGGEKLNKSLYEEIQKIFPNAKLLNIYASTEAGALFASKGENFIVKKEMQSFLRVKNNVLYIHKSKVGNSETIVFEDNWYNTGDLVEVVAENPLEVKFISRQNEMINTGGYKVNPHEVEEIINNYEGVKEAKVYGKANSILGNVVCVDIVATREISKNEIVQYLKGYLQEFKIPRIFKFVSEIEKTKTGKVKR